MPEQSTYSRIDSLLDKEDIRELRLRYSTLLDNGQTDRMDEVFTEDAQVVVTVGSMSGLPEIRAGLTQAFKDFNTQGRSSHPFVHAIANHAITVTGPDSAIGDCYLLDFVTDRTAERHPFLLLGHYRDTYARVNGAWRIARTELDTLWPDNVAA